MNKTLTAINLSNTEAIAIQQIHDNIEDDVSVLSNQLYIPHSRVVALIVDLKHKGLLIIRHDYCGTWVRLSSKGNRLAKQLWPESTPQPVWYNKC